MHYTRRDLRAADMLALVFVGFGIALLAIGLVALVDGEPRGGTDDTKFVSSEPAPQPLAEVDVKKSAPAKRLAPPVALFVMGFVCLCLGTAVHLKLRQLKRTGGKEPEDYEGVPAS